MTTDLTLASDHRPDGTPVLAATGEIDMSNARTFAEALSGALPSTGPLVVDLTAVEYLDSAGLAVLFPHVEQLELVASPLLAPVLTIAGLDDITSIR